MLCWMMANKHFVPVDRLIVVIKLTRSIDVACAQCLSPALQMLLRVFPARLGAMVRALYSRTARATVASIGSNDCFLPSEW